MTLEQLPSIAELLDRIVGAEAASAEALERQDTNAQNRWADRRHAAIQMLLSRGKTGQDALEGLLRHEQPLVRLAAATNVLKWAPQRSVPVLEELLAWAYEQTDEQHPKLRPMVAFLVLSDTEFLLSKHYGIRPREVVRTVLGIEENRRPWT